MITLQTLVLGVSGIALILTFLTKLVKKDTKAFIAFLQYFVATLFIFSGTVKAIDPIGTALKMKEYFEVFEDYGMPPLLAKPLASSSLAFSILMIVLEIVWGLMLLFGIRRLGTAFWLFLMTAFFTFLTGFTLKTGKVTDCGCFGDFMKLEPIQTFGKDIVLSVMLIILMFGYRYIVRWFPPRQIVVKTEPPAILTGKATDPNKYVLRTHFLARILPILFTVGALGFCLYNSYWDIPVVDFRPFKKAVNVPKAKAWCEAHPDSTVIDQYIYLDTIKNEKIYYKTAMDIMKDSLRTSKKYVDRQQRLVRKGCDSKVKDFSLIATDSTQAEVTNIILENENYTFLVVATYLNETNTEAFKQKINALAAAAEKDKLTLLVATATGREETEKFRHDLQAAYPFANGDVKMLHTIIRANPGILLLKGGTIIEKWHWRHLPDYQTIKQTYFK